ncbi:MAG: HAD family hydrolase [Spirochaetota bacterium]
MNYYRLPWLSQIRFMIFDMDGTLYQDLEFHRELCRLALEGTRFESQTHAVIELVERVLDGDPRLPMPDFVRLHEIEGAITASNPVSPAIQLYSAPRLRLGDVTIADHVGDDPVSLADGWSVSFAVLRIFALPSVDRRAAFYAVRERMRRRLRPHPCLNEALRTSSLYKILQTNSPEDTGRDFIEALLEPEAFEEIVCDAEKPRGLHRALQRLIDGGARPEEILSVGDHPWNDLKPARDLGCRTALISPYAGMPHGPWDLRLETLDELAELVRAAGVGYQARTIMQETHYE